VHEILQASADVFFHVFMSSVDWLEGCILFFVCDCFAGGLSSAFFASGQLAVDLRTLAVQRATACTEEL